MIGSLPLALKEVVATEFVVRLAAPLQMIGDHEDRVSDCDDGLVVSVATLDPRVLRGQVSARFCRVKG